jgi:hypothetical protein
MLELKDCMNVQSAWSAAQCSDGLELLLSVFI